MDHQQSQQWSLVECHHDSTTENGCLYKQRRTHANSKILYRFALDAIELLFMNLGLFLSQKPGQLLNLTSCDSLRDGQYYYIGNRVNRPPARLRGHVSLTGTSY